MCGIFAFISHRGVAPHLIQGLKRLEYRGYDSAGVALAVTKEAAEPGADAAPTADIFVCKRAGKVTVLENALPDSVGDATVGIAHTRWATHGPPNDANSHPHMSRAAGGDGLVIAVVHNGIIDNCAPLRQELTRKGYIFSSATDTEVIAHLIQDVRTHMLPAPCPWEQVVSVALRLLRGTYGLCVMVNEEPDKIFTCRKGAPLILGLGKGEHYVSSDASALVEHTQEVVYMRDDEMAVLERERYVLHDIRELLEVALAKLDSECAAPEAVRRAALNRESVVRRIAHLKEQVTPSPHLPDLPDLLAADINPVVRLEMSLETIEKQGFEHFMLKEICDQPNSVRNTMRGRVVRGDDGLLTTHLGGLGHAVPGVADARVPTDIMAGAKRLIFVACGTSWHASLMGEYLIEEHARIPVDVEYAAEFRYRKHPLIGPDDVVIAISQSGETADTLEAIRLAKQHGALTIGLVNVVGSTISRETDAGVFLHAGPEIGVASTKAFTSQVVVLMILALDLARRRGSLAAQEVHALCEQLEQLPSKIKECLDLCEERVRAVARLSKWANNFLFMGRGVNFPVALEGALKLKEISYIHAEGYQAAEMKHGPLALIDRFMPVVVVAPGIDPVFEKIMINVEEVRARGGAIIAVTETGNELFQKMSEEDADLEVVHFPECGALIQPLVANVPLQLLSYHIARRRGCEIDQPRNLAKSVTVE